MFIRASEDTETPINKLLNTQLLTKLSCETYPGSWFLAVRIARIWITSEMICH